MILLEKKSKDLHDFAGHLRKVPVNGDFVENDLRTSTNTLQTLQHCLTSISTRTSEK